MTFKIGFSAEEKKENPAGEVQQETKAEVKPKPSLVVIRFPDIYKSYTYYNDRFDLHEGNSAQHDSLEGVIVNEIVELCCDGSDSHGGISFLCSGVLPQSRDRAPIFKQSFDC